MKKPAAVAAGFVCLSDEKLVFLTPRRFAPVRRRVQAPWRERFPQLAVPAGKDIALATFCVEAKR